MWMCVHLTVLFVGVLTGDPPGKYVLHVRFADPWTALMQAMMHRSASTSTGLQQPPEGNLVGCATSKPEAQGGPREDVGQNQALGK